MSDSGTPFSPKGDASDASIAVRMLMQGKEVGSIIGNKGEIVKRMREESGAKIFISAGSSPERIVTVTGNTEAIYKAFQLICTNIEEAMERHANTHGGGRGARELSVKLIVPSSQCGSIIGKGGAKIKEIRDLSGSNIVVSNDMLPDSTERTVSISGSNEAIAQCVYHVCVVMLEAPPKGATIPYRPKPMGGPQGGMMFGGGLGGGLGAFGGGQDAFDSGRFQPKSQNPLASLLGAMGGGGGGAPHNPLQASTSAVTALAALAGSQLRTPRGVGPNAQTHEITVPNELIGCIIGKGGTKIAEIRQLTGAMITISKFDGDKDDATNQERVITIRGNSDQVALAKYLINTSVEMHKANLEDTAAEEEEGDSGLNPNAIPLANLLKNPAALNALSSLTNTNINLNSLGGLQELLAGDGTGQPSGLNRGHKSYVPRMRALPGGSSPPREQKRNKFQPY